jgi:hypothetical protein
MARGRYAPIAGEHHIVRRCNYQVIERDTQTKQVKGLFPQAMMLRRAIDERYLSVNWLEHFAGGRNERLKVIVNIHRKKIKTRLSVDSGIAVLNVKRVLEIGEFHQRKLNILSTATADDPSYSRVTGLPFDNSNELLVLTLAQEAYRDFMLLREVDSLP